MDRQNPPVSLLAMANPHPSLLALAADRPMAAVHEGHELVRSATEHRLAGLLWTRVAAGEIDLALDSRSLLEEAELAGWARNNMLAEVARHVTETASAMDVEVAVMKGAPAEARWYNRLGERPSYDVDVAVHPRHIGRVPDLVGVLHPSHSLLPTLGFLIKGGALQSVDLSYQSMPVDLHWDPLKLELVKTIHAEELWRRTELVTLPNGAVIRAFDAEASLIGHLLHLNKDRFRYLLGFADVARILQRVDLDWTFIRQFLDAEGLRTPVAMSLATVLDRLDLPNRFPLKSTSKGRALAWDLGWPASTQLLGDTGRVRFRYRQFLIPITGRGRTGEAIRGYLRRLVPPAELFNYYYPTERGPYLWRLLTARLRRRAGRRHVRAIVSNESGP